MFFTYDASFYIYDHFVHLVISFQKSMEYLIDTPIISTNQNHKSDESFFDNLNESEIEELLGDLDLEEEISDSENE